MEPFTQAPIDQERRRLIQLLLGLPLASVGFASLPPLGLIEVREVLSMEGKRARALDLHAYQN